MGNLWCWRVAICKRVWENCKFFQKISSMATYKISLCSGLINVAKWISCIFIKIELFLVLNLRFQLKSPVKGYLCCKTNLWYATLVWVKVGSSSSKTTFVVCLELSQKKYQKPPFYGLLVKMNESQLWMAKMVGMGVVCITPGMRMELVFGIVIYVNECPLHTYRNPWHLYLSCFCCCCWCLHCSLCVWANLG